LAGVAAAIAAAAWLRGVLVAFATAAGVVFLGMTLRLSGTTAHCLLVRLVEDGVLDNGWRALHHRFGTPWRSVDFVAAAQVALVRVSGGETSWIARAYAMALVVTAVLSLAALVRYRRTRPEKRA